MRTILVAGIAAWCMGIALGAHAQEVGESPPPMAVTLENAITWSLNAAPGLRAGDAAIQAAKAGVRQARVRPNPELGVEVENFAGSGRVGGFDSTEFTFSASQKIERGGKRKARTALASRDVDVARQEQAIARLDLIYDVERAYIEAASATAALANAIARAETAAEIEAVARRRVENAKDPITALHRASAQALRASVDAEQAERWTTLAARRLSALWNAPDTAYRIEPAALHVLPSEDGVVPTESAETVPDLALYEAAEARAAAAAALARAQARQDPTIGIGVRYLRDEEDVAGILSFSVPIPVFDANRGAIARANAERLSAEWAALDAQRRLERERMAQEGALKASRREALAVRQALIPAAEKALASAREGYTRGAFTYLEVLDAQNLVSDLRDREIAALKRFHFARAALNRSTARHREPLPGEEFQP